MSCCDSSLTSRKVAQGTKRTLNRKYAQPKGRSTRGAGTLEIVLHQILEGVILFVLLAGNSALTPLSLRGLSQSQAWKKGGYCVLFCKWKKIKLTILYLYLRIDHSYVFLQRKFSKHIAFALQAKSTARRWPCESRQICRTQSVACSFFITDA